MSQRIQRRRVSSEQFEASWRPYVQPDANGVTAFMHACIASVEKASLNLSFEKRTRAPPGEYFFEATIPGTAYLAYVNLDGAEVSRPNGNALLRAERWDYDSPQQLIEAFISALLRARAASKHESAP